MAPLGQKMSFRNLVFVAFPGQIVINIRTPNDLPFSTWLIFFPTIMICICLLRCSVIFGECQLTEIQFKFLNSLFQGN